MKNYFKKFSIMFVMLLSILGVGILQHGTIANAVTVGQTQLKSPELGWTRIDDANDKISYTENWETNKTNENYNSTLHSSWIANNTVKFKFYGTKLRIIGDVYKNKSTNISINIDTNIESFNEYDASLVQCQTVIYEKLNLPLTTHTVTITTNDSSNVVIDAIDIDASGQLLPYNESVSLNKSSMNLIEGASEQLNQTTTPSTVGVTWASSDSTIATVDNTGNVTAIKEGQATITATMNDGSNLTATCIVNVTKQTTPTSGITLNKTSDSIIIGETDDLVATTTPVAVGVTWTSSDPSIATVDSNGRITAIKEGQVTIKVTTTDGSNLSATCTVNVTIKDEPQTPTDPTESEYIVNTANAKGDNTNNASGSVTIIFHGTAETTLTVVKTADVKEVWVGDNFTYTIVVTNTGSKTAKDVVVNDSAPNHIEFKVDGITTTHGEVDSSSTSKNIIVNVGDIPPLGTVTIKVPVTVIL